MNRLLAIEWNKLFYNKTTRNFTIIYFLILALGGVIIATIKPDVGGMKLNMVQLGTFNFPVIWQNIAYILAIAKIFLAVIIISNITTEYENSTFKQNLIDGLTKREFLISKLLSNVVLAVISTAFILVITLILGLLFSKTDTSFYVGMQYVGTYFLKLVLFFTICSTLAILLKRTAYAFLGLFAYWMLEGILKIVDDFVIDASFSFANYLPLATSNKLVPAPDFSLQDFILSQGAFHITPMNWVYVLLAIVYIFAFALLSNFILKKRDL